MVDMAIMDEYNQTIFTNPNYGSIVPRVGETVHVHIDDSADDSIKSYVVTKITHTFGPEEQGLIISVERKLGPKEVLENFRLATSS
jgi:hypothetical protein